MLASKEKKKRQGSVSCATREAVVFLILIQYSIDLPILTFAIHYKEYSNLLDLDQSEKPDVHKRKHIQLQLLCRQYCSIQLRKEQFDKD